MRFPGQSALIFVVLALMVSFSGSALLFTGALSYTAGVALKNGPALVVRKTDNGGWAPLPVAESLATVAKVRGITRAEPRIWGLVQGPDGPLTVVGVTDASTPLPGIPLFPSPGTAIAGPELSAAVGTTLQLASAGGVRRYEITGLLPVSASGITNDIVLLTADDARELLGISPGFASDLALDVYHDSEEQAVLPDLSAAFPWPVSITTRSQSLGRYTGDITRRGGLFMLVSIPSVLALVLLVLATYRSQQHYRHEIGLQKTMGWTTGDILFVHGVKSLFIGIPALIIGAASAYAFVFSPLAILPARILFDWKSSPPLLFMPVSGMALSLAIVCSVVVLPWLAAALWPIFRASSTDPQLLVLKREI